MHRFVQLYEQIKYVRDEKEKMDKWIDEASKNEYRLIIEKYQDLVDNIIDKLEIVNTMEEVSVPEGFD